MTQTQTTKGIDYNKKATIYNEEPVIGNRIKTTSKPRTNLKKERRKEKRKTCRLVYVNVCPQMLYFNQALQISYVKPRSLIKP